LFGEVLPANERNIGTARNYMRQLQAGGGTEMLPALAMALDGRWDRTRLRQVIFMTDGAVSNEQEFFQTITDRVGDAHLFTVGIGSAPNKHFMRGAARQGRETFIFIGAPNQVGKRMAQLWDKLAKPVVTHLTAKPLGEGSLEIWPNPIPDLFSGEPVVFAFRYGKDLEGVKVSGIGADGSWVHGLNIETATPGQGIVKLWAREKIAGIKSSLFQRKTPDRVRDGVLSEALQFCLVTRHTSLVAVKKKPSRPDNIPLATKKMPTNWPQGWEPSKVFNTPDWDGNAFQNNLLKRARQHYKSAGPTLLASASPVADSAGPMGARNQSVHLPQTATRAELYLLIGFVLLCLGLIIWWTDPWRGEKP
jgi:Ca-activated chloride channel family protein